jgi:hypothetical protein
MLINGELRDLRHPVVRAVPVPFLAHFAAVADPRQVAKVLSPLAEILLVLL